MTRSSCLILPLLLALAACATPQQQCINSVAGNLHALDGLILQTQGNLQRGFAYTQVVRNVPQFVPCGGGWNGTGYNNTDMCLVNTVQTFQQPAAIDLAAARDAAFGSDGIIEAPGFFKVAGAEADVDYHVILSRMNSDQSGAHCASSHARALLSFGPATCGPTISRTRA